MRIIVKFFFHLSLIFFLGNCSSLHKHTANFEVSNYIADHVSEIPVNIFNDDLVINLVNAASAEKIVLYFKVGKQLSKNRINVAIKCMSQCGIEFAGDLKDLHIDNLNLINAHLLKNPPIKVNNINIQASEAIKTGLPIVIEKAQINISSSKSMLAVQKLLKGVNIMPGSGEFIYDTKIIYDVHGKAINSYNGENIADALYNLQSLKRILPNLAWAAPVISWFGVSTDNNKTSMDISKIDIVPGVEKRKARDSEIWRVGKYDRKNAQLVSMGSNNHPNYGGTINDNSLMRYVDSLSSHQLKIMFYPVIFMDMPGKPWRGYMKSNNTKDIHEFFTKDKGYNAFILHYAYLLKGKIDAFAIGSEMQDLTQSVDETYQYPDPRRYPAVLELIDLAKQVKEILGDKVKVTYAANWSEYHHDREGVYHLDPLWSSEYIDVVGIDAYLPITNKSMGDITVDEIKQGWESGELWDYYYDRNNKSSIPPEWGLKQIEYWWKNEHWKRGVKTSWEPKMKPIWFTEFGFPSMHMATNTPNIFWDPKSAVGGVPRKSSGKPDFAIQMRAIMGTLEYWQNKGNVVQNMFLWAWDVRPFPYYPQKLDIWSDGDLWSRGHWINGKIEPLSQVRLLPNCDINILQVDADELVIEGNFISNSIIAKDVQYISSK